MSDLELNMLPETITVSGHPLPGPVTLTGAYINEESGWLLDHDEAQKLLEAWKTAPAAEDVVREWAWFDSAEVMVTSLLMEGEITIDTWIDSSGFHTADMPFDFKVERENPAAKAAAYDEIAAILGSAETWSDPAGFLEDIAKVMNAVQRSLGAPLVDGKDTEYWEARA